MRVQGEKQEENKGLKHSILIRRVVLSQQVTETAWNLTHKVVIPESIGSGLAGPHPVEVSAIVIFRMMLRLFNLDQAFWKT